MSTRSSIWLGENRGKYVHITSDGGGFQGSLSVAVSVPVELRSVDSRGGCPYVCIAGSENRPRASAL